MHNPTHPLTHTPRSTARTWESKGYWTRHSTGIATTCAISDWAAADPSSLASSLAGGEHIRLKAASQTKTRFVYVCPSMQSGLLVKVNISNYGTSDADVMLTLATFSLKCQNFLPGCFFAFVLPVLYLPNYLNLSRFAHGLSPRAGPEPSC